MRFRYLNFLFSLALMGGFASTGQQATPPTLKRTPAGALERAPVDLTKLARQKGFGFDGIDPPGEVRVR
jgi:hypothetical protein